MGRFSSGLIGLAAVFGLAACSAEQGGSCPGTEDGTYFQLQMYNFLQQSGVEVKLNGRYIGTIDQPQTDGQGNLIEPGEALLGTFPVCDKNVLNAGAGPLSQRFCSTSQLFDPNCEMARPDGCWASFYIVGPSAPVPPTPSDYMTPQCYLSPGTFLGTSNGQPVYAYPCQNDWVRC